MSANLSVYLSSYLPTFSIILRLPQHQTLIFEVLAKGVFVTLLAVRPFLRRFGRLRSIPRHTEKTPSANLPRPEPCENLEEYIPSPRRCKNHEIQNETHLYPIAQFITSRGHPVSDCSKGMNIKTSCSRPPRFASRGGFHVHLGGCAWLKIMRVSQTILSFIAELRLIKNRAFSAVPR